MEPEPWRRRWRFPQDAIHAGREPPEGNLLLEADSKRTWLALRPFITS
jgi:hypothetical protein